jgi:uroporphyrinogen III methyltransferase/synthase
VGAGPGSPDLITVRGLEVLRQAEVVIFDYLLDRRLLEAVPETAELICADKLDGKNQHANGLVSRQKNINQLMISKAKQGKRVVRLKNGDPAIFGRLSEELTALVNSKTTFEIVPAVTAASAASAFSGIPLTDRKFASTCVFVTGRESPQKKISLIDWQALVKMGTIVFYMALDCLELVSQKLIKAGKDRKTAVALIQAASLLTQKIILGDLSNIARKAKGYNLKSPAIAIIGKTVRFSKRFAWLNNNRRILFTGLSKERFFLKGKYEHIPFIKIRPLADYCHFDAQLKDIADFDWIIFTSRYGVEYFFKRLNAVGLDGRSLAKVKLAAIGDSTRKRLLDHLFNADLVPKDESSRGLIRELKQLGLQGKKVFLPRSNLSDKGLEQALEDMGSIVTSSIAYENVMPEYLPDIDLNEFNEIMFTSPSTIRNFVNKYNHVPPELDISYIGEVTLKEARRWGLLT